MSKHKKCIDGRLSDYEVKKRINAFIHRMAELVFLENYASSRDVTNKINSAFINILGISPENREK